MTTMRALAAAIASGLSLAPAHATAPRAVRVPPVPHSQPARAAESTNCPASAPHSQPGLSLEQRAFRATHRGPYDTLIADAALAHGFDPHWLKGLVEAESGGDPTAVNRVSWAAGLGQHTRTGRRGVNALRCRRQGRPPGCPLGDLEFTRARALQPAESIQATTEYLAEMTRRFGRFGGAVWYNGGRYRRAFAWRVLRHANRFRVESGLPPLPAPPKERKPERRPEA